MSAGNKRTQIAIKTLVEFAAKTGSLDRRFTPAPTGQEGIEGHQKVTAQRHSEYQAELPLSGEYLGLRFRGRADGYDPHKHSLEEIKTFYGDWKKIPENHRQLHWAQLKCYGWLYCAESGCDEIDLTLIYFELNSEVEYPEKQRWHAGELKSYFEELANRFHQWHHQQQNRLRELQVWLTNLQFPFGNMHVAQRMMAENVYKSAATGKVSLAEAPTGTGKTLGSLFPALKAIAHTPVDKIFFLTAKTTGKQLALESIQQFKLDQAPLRTLELTAQEKMCLAPGKQCQGDDCPYAKDFYSKLIPAREAAEKVPLLDKQALTQLGQTFGICPFYLSMEMARWADVIVADVNYYFDGTPLLLALTQEFEWKPYLLIDECHNLIDRGRSMYTAELNRAELLIAKKSAPEPIKKTLDKINKHWLTITKKIPVDQKDWAPLMSSAAHKLPLTDAASYLEQFKLLLEQFTNRYIDFLQKNPNHTVQNTLVQEFFFAALNYLRITEWVDDNYCIDLQGAGSKAERLTLRNIIPAKLLAERLKQSAGACFFSATLKPTIYYKTLLGLSDDCVSLAVPSPFSAHQLAINISTHLSTRYKDRQAAIAPLCDLICTQIQKAPGNALVFFSSYDFLQQVATQLQQRINPAATRLITQARNMTEQEREQFIQQFNQYNNLLGLAVLGGAFSEGIDLAGDALKGAFIATLGLPQVNPINEHIKSIMDAEFGQGQGYDYTYTYPGLQKVIQAAGRVIRKTSDTGYLWLLDDRFQKAEIQALFPHWWHINQAAKA